MQAGQEISFAMEDLNKKVTELQEIISSLQRVIVAFSGGTDSTLLLRYAKEILEDNAIAVTAASEIIPEKEVEEAKRVAAEIGADHRIILLKPLQNADFVANPPERCYYCKQALCGQLQEIAKKEGAFVIVDGTNKDDAKDFRPGQKAASEWGLRSPLLEAGLTKHEIRILSKRLNLPTWDKPSKACLASRFPYGQKITREKLRRVEEAEEAVSNLGLKQVRVRLHDENTARIEVEEEGIERLLGADERMQLVRKLQKLGFIYITVDLRGYQSGSLNELIKE